MSDHKLDGYKTADIETEMEIKNTPTDKQLKQALAKMVPGGVVVWYDNPQFPNQATLRYLDNGREIFDTELNHLCWFVRQRFNIEQRVDYLNAMRKVIGGKVSDYDIADAGWEKQVLALAKVKGVEV